MKRKFDSCYVAFNVENRKLDRPDYDENKNLFNPTICLLEENDINYIMSVIKMDDATAILDELEKWYLANHVIDNLKIFRKSTNEVTLYKNRYWKDEFSKRLFGGIQ